MAELTDAKMNCGAVHFAGPASLKQHQDALLELLCELHRVCGILKIPYMLFAGSLLGAVRHGGFIPWDDDADVIIPRREYDLLLNEAEGIVDRKRFFLQKEYSEHWPMPFSKLRLNGTACIERYIPRDGKTHQGVYIDIFPLDVLYDGRIASRMQFMASRVAVAKCLDKRGYITRSVGKKLFLLLCRMLPQRPFVRLTRADGRYTESAHCFFGAASKYAKSVFPRQWFSERVLLSFEGRKFYAPCGYREILATLYGDYMIPTPEKNRGRKVHAEIVDLDNSYEIYTDIQKSMRIRELSESIR